MSLKLRDYQERTAEAIRQAAKDGNKRILVVAPTGSGKTAQMTELTIAAIEKGNKVLALMHRRGLVEQMAETFTNYGIETGFIMAGVDSNVKAKCQIASMWTYVRRMKLAEKELNNFWIDTNFILIDEAHHVLNNTYQKILKHYPDAFVLGFTATPTLSTGAGLGNYFETMIDVVSMKELIDGKYLVPGVYYGPSEPDLSELKTVQGDYEKKGLDEKLNQPKIIGDVVDNWLEYARDKQTMVFSINRKHGKALNQEFLSRGVASEYLDAHNNDEERSDVIRRFRDGDTQVICQVALYTEGTDIKEIECLVLARPTKSIGLHRQILGRGARPCKGKDDFLVLDHGGNVARLSYYEDEMGWTLDNTKQANKPKEQRKKEKTIITCEYCSHLFTGKRCPNCGKEVKGYAKKIAAIEAKLVPLGKAEVKKKFTPEQRRQWIGMLEYHRREKGYKPGWTKINYRELTGHWPNMGNIGPIEPTKEFKNWITYKNIKWAKGKKRKENKGGYNYSQPYWNGINR